MPSAASPVPFVVIGAMGIAMVGFALLWRSVVRRLADRGWRHLAARYPGHRSPNLLPSLARLRINGVRYQGFGIRVQVTEDALRLRVPFPFHPPVSIPWSAVRGHRWVDGALQLQIDGFEGELTLFGGPAARATRRLGMLPGA